MSKPRRAVYTESETINCATCCHTIDCKTTHFSTRVLACRYCDYPCAWDKNDQRDPECHNHDQYCLDWRRDQ